MNRITIDDVYRHCLRQIGRYNNNNSLLLFKEIIEQLKEYQNLEEQGLLLKLPCKVGDTVWIVGTKCLAAVVPIEECERMQCGDCPYNDEYIVFKGKADARMISYLTFEKHELFVFGKTVFLTKAEAEAKLKEMEEKQNE